MIYANSFAAFLLMFIFGVIIAAILTAISRFTKNADLKKRIESFKPTIDRVIDFTFFMTLASLALAVILKDPPELLIPQNAWKLIEEHGSWGVLFFVGYVWLILDRRLGKVESATTHLEKDVESLRDDVKSLSNEIKAVKDDLSREIHEEIRHVRDDIRELWKSK